MKLISVPPNSNFFRYYFENCSKLALLCYLKGVFSETQHVYKNIEKYESLGFINIINVFFSAVSFCRIQAKGQRFFQAWESFIRIIFECEFWIRLANEIQKQLHFWNKILKIGSKMNDMKSESGRRKSARIGEKPSNSELAILEYPGYYILDHAFRPFILDLK